MNREWIFELINIERGRQDTLHGHKNEKISSLDSRRMRIMGEEFGECCSTLDSIDNSVDYQEREILIKHYLKENIEVAACAIQNVEKILQEYPELFNQ